MDHMLSYLHAVAAAGAAWLAALHRDDRGADAVEYLVTIAVVMVAVVAAVASGIGGDFATGVISAVKSVVVSCADGTKC